MWSCAFVAVVFVALANAAPVSLQPATFVGLGASMVRVEVSRERGALSVGTGVTIAPAIIVTNCHVTRDAAAIRISGGGRLWDVTGQYADANHDVCFLHAPHWQGPPVILGERDALHLGEAVAAIGFTGGTGLSLRFGTVRALHAFDGGRIIESDTAFTSGASGGGLFDSAGSLVGLLTFRSRGETGTYYALPVGWIRDGLPSERQWDAVHPLSDAVPFWQRDLATLPYFMRAPPLYAEGRWNELIELTERWSASDPRDAEPLRVRGDAQRKMDRNEFAVFSYIEALHIAPDDARAWYGLALAYAGLGDVAALKRTESMLVGFDPALATRLHAELEWLHRPGNGLGPP
ncbi:MAG TPA: trypsin-like peptidase domain-containing protein [Casimicrobiaceae bacterium]